VLPILKFIRNFIEENPLICCYDEISMLKKLLCDKDKLKLKQKNSAVNLTVHQGLYYFKSKLEVPDNYPSACVMYVLSLFLILMQNIESLLIYILCIYIDTYCAFVV